MNLFTNMKIRLGNGAEGTIQSAFGKSGKFKAFFPDGFRTEAPTVEPILLSLKRFLFEEKRSFHQ